MWTTSTLALALAALAHATPFNINERATPTPTLYLAGDSTMAKLSSPTDGTALSSLPATSPN